MDHILDLYALVKINILLSVLKHDQESRKQKFHLFVLRRLQFGAVEYAIGLIP